MEKFVTDVRCRRRRLEDRGAPERDTDLVREPLDANQVAGLVAYDDMVREGRDERGRSVLPVGRLDQLPYSGERLFQRTGAKTRNLIIRASRRAQ